MKFSNLNCKIQIYTTVNPSEDPAKIHKSILNIFPNCKISNDDFQIKGETTNLQSLEKIYETIHSTQSQKVLQRQLEKHIDNNSTWFYLNKQAAFVEKVVMCDEADESPLGPLKIIIYSTNIDRIIDILVLDNKQIS